MCREQPRWSAGSFNWSPWLHFIWRTGGLFTLKLLLTEGAGKKRSQTRRFWTINLPGILVYLTPAYQERMRISSRELLHMVSSRDSPQSPQYSPSVAEPMPLVLLHSPIRMRPCEKGLRAWEVEERSAEVGSKQARASTYRPGLHSVPVPLSTRDVPNDVDTTRDGDDGG